MGAQSHTASLEEANAARLPIGWRDNCSALLIPLNKCRHQTLYAPWKCEDERCQYDDFIRRQRELSKKKLEEASE
ncbi:hypothetical protein OC834_005981 [Tilletia horrida]|uniref:NADH dehydrogenase [ubiquinone] 1 beta subcomplex subunit 7 n=1 Tax=Tilletia horrida TaxID=155126 RepID=A0AAN6GE59_9BASI|nr:hypothetical protein OC834_005981 [Tilletia horrida]KAK0532219.1 hypothetical protein OC842_003358 [Tilletia horrida]